MALLGLAFTALGVAGVFLPVLPTTPFLLLAAACFARSSPAWHRRLLGNRTFGPYIQQWQRDRTIPLAAKRKAYCLVFATFALSLALVDAPGSRGALLAIGLLLICFLAWLPTTRAGQDLSPESGSSAH